jgi:hypothetical protein
MEPRRHGRAKEWRGQARFPPGPCAEGVQSAFGEGLRDLRLEEVATELDDPIESGQNLAW